MCVFVPAVSVQPRSPPPTLTFLIVAFLNCVNESKGGGVVLVVVVVTIWKREEGGKGEVILHINAHSKMRSCGEVMP